MTTTTITVQWVGLGEEELTCLGFEVLDSGTLRIDYYGLRLFAAPGTWLSVEERTA